MIRLRFLASVWSMAALPVVTDVVDAIEALVRDGVRPEVRA